jgi:hypothetical protein
MNYFVKRDNQEFGPYSLAEMQRYVAAGNILLTDLARSEAMTDWMPVSSVIGTIPVPAQPASQTYQPPAVEYPLPPGLHWAVVLLLSVVTCGIFSTVWMFVQSSYVRRLVPTNRAIIWYAIGVGLMFGAGFLRVPLRGSEVALISPLCNLVGAGFLIAGHFSMKGGLEDHFNGAENIGLSLSGVMVFFFNVLYFQYHFNKIRDARQQIAMTVGA